MKFTLNTLHCLLAFYIVRRARLRLELFPIIVSTCKFLSQMSCFVLVPFSSGHAVALLRESYTFV